MYCKLFTREFFQGQTLPGLSNLYSIFDRRNKDGPCKKNTKCNNFKWDISRDVRALELKPVTAQERFYCMVQFILRFEEALQVFETTGCAGIDVGVIKDAIKEIYDEHVSHIIKQVGDG